MIPAACKRLAEVDFPIAEVSRHAAREKSIRHGHPSTLHLWWARRPLASSRAVLLALLLPDPDDKHCPAEFRQTAIGEIKRFAEHVTQNKAGSERLVADLKSARRDRDLQTRLVAKAEAERRGQKWMAFASNTDWSPRRIRAGLLQLVASGSSWEFAADKTYRSVVCNLVKAAHPDETPLVVDPFAGGGSIPLEAPAPRLRDLRQRPQSRRLPHPQGDAGGYSPGTGRGWPTNCERLARRSRPRQRRNWPICTPRTRMGSRPSLTCGRERCAAKPPTVAAEIPLMRSMWLCRKPEP